MTEIDYTALLQTYYETRPRARKLTRDEFEAECIALSGGTVELLREYHDIVPCDCGEFDCPGWKAVYRLKNKREARRKP